MSTARPSNSATKYALIHRFPIEIIIEIFAQTIPELPSDILARGNIYRPPWHVGRSIASAKIDLDPWQYSPHRSRLTLLLVCKYWATIVKSTPRLWKSVYCDPSFFKKPSHNYSTLKRIISQSGDHNLDVCIDVRNRNRLVAMTPEDFLRFAAILRPYVPRMRTFMLIGTTQNATSLTPMKVSPIFEDSGPHVDVPYLETLAFVNCRIPTIFHAPRLTTLVLVNNHPLLGFTEESISSVRSLTISVVHLDILPKCHAVETLYLVASQWDDYASNPCPDGILLPRLKHFEIFAVLCGHSNICHFDRFNTPALKSLVLNCLGCESYEMSRAVIEFEGILPFLTHLCLTNLDDDVYELEQMFVQLTHLTTLELQDCSPDDRFFIGLMVGGEDTTPDADVPCPRLETMICRNTPVKPSLLSDIITSRTKPIPRTVHGRPLPYLKTLIASPPAPPTTAEEKKRTTKAWLPAGLFSRWPF